VETRTVSVPFHPYEHLGAAGRRVFGDPVELPASGQSPSGRDEPAPWDVEAIALDTEAVGAEETER
jgi:hypothetical protein